MALTYSNEPKLGSEAPSFSLPGVDGKIYSPASFKNAKVLVVTFMCNHCPYVIAIQERLNQLAKEYSPRGVSVVGINSNDSVNYPEDNFEAMKVRSKEQGYVFPYLHDESQAVAHAYGAVCTPDFFVYANEGGKFLLRYAGRLDDNWKEPRAVTRRELAEALDAILAGKKSAEEQKPSMGCSIKWK